MVSCYSKRSNGEEDGSMMPTYEDDKCEWNNTSDKGVLIKPGDCKNLDNYFHVWVKIC